MTSSEQARADAMADAETLVLLLAYHWPNGTLPQELDEPVTELMIARALPLAIGMDEALASAAFRAVPGLRG